ncbi:hypothetical protein GCM10023194_22100 [Planotetraspora phitsanulokensis]|uniref:Phosphatidylserine/phosphatidylglycerophosphate/ cardiolipin synthase family protein n=1 Tax=Planotetraspora phitsanulokensis TaxID=575192 RepID=A0A8J3U591_9ACTN|nr:hypothetical protein [Planotetraspora phitsanulokensis]GII38267.1 hypothetical protein Pph01_32700 [Planotetraspora phitsanulokensis]
MTVKSKLTREIMPPTLRKILITAAVGVPTYFVTDDNGPFLSAGAEPQAWGLILTVLISAVVTVVQYLIDVDKQLEATRREVVDGLSRINEATELFGLVEASAVQTDVVTQLVRNATRVDKGMPALVQAFAQTEIARISTLLRELGEGNVIYEGEDRDWLLGLTANTRRSLDALSLNMVDQGITEFDGGFWTTDAGQRYLEAQRDRIREGVRIRRIFFVDRSEVESEKFRRICKMHSEIGVQVRVLTPDTLVTPLGLFDFIVFDDVVSYEVTPSPQVGEITTHTFVHTLLVLEPPQVKRRTDRFSELWELSSPLA